VVVEPGKPALTQIAEHFGEAILLADQTLNRAALREKIFANPDDKKWLEALLHPLIAEEITRGLAAATSPYVIFVSPLLIESDQKSFCNRLLVIDVPEQLQLERTTKRDNNDEAQVKRIIASQASRQQRLDLADDVINNTNGLDELLAKVEKMHQQYLQLAAETTQ
jgi:dephospho-CoA kinase